MKGLVRFVLALAVLLEANFLVHVQSVLSGSHLHKGPEGGRRGPMIRRVTTVTSGRQACSQDSNSPVKEVPVIRDEDIGLGLMDMLKPPLNESGLKPKEINLGISQQS